MKIGILGAGNVGGTLGKRWESNGHSIVYSTRDTVAQTAAFGDAVLLATPWPATEQVVKSAAAELKGKVLIDAVNPLLPDLSGLTVGTSTSASEMVAQWAPGAKVVKAFNTVGSPIMADPSLGGHKALLFYCGDDADAKNTVAGLAEEIGFDAQDAGPHTQARLLEPFALLWISLAFTRGYGRDFAFQIVRR